jgi:prepilin-type N-terminal cleavage/methylation domain-containing protein
MKRMSPVVSHSTTATGFTLVELLVVIGIIAVLMSLLISALGGAREQGQRVACANQLRQLVLAMNYYAGAEHSHSYPRTKYDPTKDKMQLDNAGYGVADTFGNSGYVGENNVPATMYLLMRSQKLNVKMLACPATEVTGGEWKGGVEENSNWRNYTDWVSYSIASPYPTPAASGEFHWGTSTKVTFALLADINPGTRGIGSGGVPNNATGPARTASATKLRAANSNNHRNKGQNVAYPDGHVVFSPTPYCGAQHRDTGVPDNIYTAGTGDFGTLDEKSMPVDGQDSVLLPTDDPGGK